MAGQNIPILLTSGMWPRMRFVERSVRYFPPPKKSWIVWSMISIDLVLQLFVALPAMGVIRPFSFGAIFCDGDDPHDLA